MNYNLDDHHLIILIADLVATKKKQLTSTIWENGNEILDFGQSGRSGGKWRLAQSHLYLTGTIFYTYGPD